LEVWRIFHQLRSQAIEPCNHCLVPAGGFYAWKPEGKGKTPYYIHPRGAQFFAFAGLYDGWTKPDGEDLCIFTIITKDT
jgi:putative SOS response-associated peptidase YedK